MTTALFSTQPASITIRAWDIRSNRRASSPCATPWPRRRSTVWIGERRCRRPLTSWRAHDRAYVDGVLAAVPASGQVMLDADTFMSPGSGVAALSAAGAACAAVDAVLAGEVANAFCAVRPPGHHAEYDRAMGFCLFNNVAVAAHHARAVHGLTAVAVVDFDVHHGNGTQHAFENDGGFFFASSHQFPFYPGTGDVREVGRGNVHNAPLPAAAGSEAFRAA